MKFLLLLLSVIAAAFSMPNWAMEQDSFPMPQVPGYPYENSESMIASQPIYTPLVQNTFEAGQTYLMLGNNQFLSVINIAIDDCIHLPIKATAGYVLPLCCHPSLQWKDCSHGYGEGTVSPAKQLQLHLTNWRGHYCCGTV